MKRIFLVIAFFFYSSLLFAMPFKHMVFFGDSLTDNGNLYHLLLKIIPKAPYYDGRFTNGLTWAEQVGNEYKNKYNIDYDIYAVGGATAEYHLPTTKFVTLTTLTEEYYQYYWHSFFQSKDDVLFAIWVGGNDYLFDSADNLPALTTQVINHIDSVMQRLIAQGARYFLLIDMPDLSITPFATENKMAKRLHDASQMHNEKLAVLVKKIRAQYPDVQITYIDSYAFLDDVVQNPQKYNDKYHTHVSNVADACWTGGMLLKKSMIDQQLAAELKNAGANQNKDLPKIILGNPDIAEAYSVSQAYALGSKECADPDSYLFWDHMHPTAVTHYVLAQIVLEQLASLH
jgi:phospholipase/lecithinase/hemolysin